MAGTLIYDASSGRYQYVIGSGSSASSAKAVKKVRTIQEMLALADYSVDVMVMRAAEGDPTVGNGWAIYTFVAEQASNPDTINGWVKVAEEESMDLKVDLSSLGFTFAADQYNSAAVHAHYHVTEGNFDYGSVIYACAPSSIQFSAFSPIALPEGVKSISAFKAHYYDATYIGDNGSPYLIECTGFTNAAKTFTGESIDLNADVIGGYKLTDDTKFVDGTTYYTKSGNDYIVATVTAGTNVTANKYYVQYANEPIGAVSALAVTPDIAIAISAGKMYVKPLYTKTATTIDKAGNLLGWDVAADGTYKAVRPEVYAWTQVGDDDKWEQIATLSQFIYAIKGDGAGGHVLYAAGNNSCYALGSAAYPNTTDVDQVAKIDFDTNMKDSVASNFGFKAYTSNEFAPISVIENGARIVPNDWADVSLGGYHVMARRATGTVEYKGKTYTKGRLYVWGSQLDGCLGDGISYGTGHDIKAAELVEKYGFPAGTQPGQIGNPEPTEVVIRKYNADGVTYTDVTYDDWIDYDAGWYHNVALRINEKGESEVYVWGSNEYGVAGNGNYNELRLQADGTYATDPDGNFEIITRPRLLTKNEFGYSDIVNVEANHYATIITRANGDVYYSGCNKRNQLGIVNATSDAVNLALFTKMSTFFNGASWDGETYGGFIVREIPYLNEDADPLFFDMFKNELALDKLATASVNQHVHTVSSEDIDSVVIAAKPFFSSYQTIIANLHSNPASGLHLNMDVLNALSATGNTLLFNGTPIQGGGGSSNGGSGVYVDLSNKVLDDAADVSGLNNLAGGMGLEVISYYRDDDTGKYFIRVCPNGGKYHPKPRWCTVGTLAADGTTFTELVSKEELQKGLYAVPGTATASAKLLNSTSDLREVINTAVSKKTYVRLIIIDKAGTGTDWINGTELKQITYTQLSAGTLVYKPCDDMSTYMPLDQVPGVSLGTHYDETEKWIDLYTKDSSHTKVLTAETAKDAGYIYEDGSVVPCAADICNPKGYDGDGNPVYMAVKTSDGASVVIAAETIANGLVKKEGTSYNAVTTRDYPEVFDDSLFESGAIYITPSKNDFTGTANQKYVFAKGQCTFIYGTTATDGVYPLESVVIPLTQPIVSDSTSTTAENFSPGSSDDPMMAVIPSKYRGYTSSVSGEYNAAVGYNSAVSGNANDVFGDFSMAAGVGNTVTADSSFATGYMNTVSATGSFAIGTNNKVGGDSNFVVGSGNVTLNYYGVAIGTANKLTGISNTAIGAMNEVHGARVITVGQRIKASKDASDAILVGSNIDTSAKKVFVVGKNAIIPANEGNFPSNTAAETMTISAFNAAGYDKEGKCNEDALIFAMGDGITANTGEPINVMVYRKWQWKMNPAYFNAASGATNRKMDPRYKIPVFEFEFAGMLNPSFCRAIPTGLDSMGNKQYEQSFRTAGRVKTCDAGLEINGAGVIELNFDLASKFKIMPSGASVTGFNLVHGVSDNGDMVGDVIEGWVDGAEAYIVAYGTNSYDWPDTWVWSNEQPTNLASMSADSFALVKLMVVDDVVIATTVTTVSK